MAKRAINLLAAAETAKVVCWLVLHGKVDFDPVLISVVALRHDDCDGTEVLDVRG